MVMSPFIYFFDIDGTLVGNVTPQIAEWDLIKRYNKSNLNIFKQNLIYHLQNGLLRPHLSTFLDSLRLKGECEFFIYTASNAEWANFLVNCIEATIGIKFNRPIFNRSHCTIHDNSYMKSISKISNAVYKKIKYKYPERLTSQSDILNYAVLIDNSRVLLKKEENLLYECPTYNYEDAFDVTRSLNEKILSSKFFEISRILQLYGMFPKYNDHTMSYSVFKAVYFTFLSDYIKNTIKINSKKKEDNFWLQIKNIENKS